MNVGLSGAAGIFALTGHEDLNGSASLRTKEDAYGEGEHSYYESPSLTEASVAALVMQHVNRYNGLRGSFDYITNIFCIV